MAGKLSGKAAIITGSSAGIGEVTAKTLAREGCKVLIAARTASDIERVVKEIKAAGGTAVGVKTDVTKTADVENMVATALREFGGVDILVNVAGGHTNRHDVWDITDEDWEETVAINYTAAFKCVRAVSKPMMARKSGRIVNFSSPSAYQPTANSVAHLPYAASKAAILCMTRHLAAQLGPHGINVNTVTPSTTLTERVKKMWTKEQLELKISQNALRRLPVPQDSANAVLYLVSEESYNVTGVNITVSAGQTLYW